MRTMIKGLVILSAASAGTFLAMDGGGVCPSGNSPETATAPVGAAASTSQATAIRRFGMPLSFEENRGQADAGVEFVARSRNFSAAFDGGTVRFSLRTPLVGAEMERAESESRARRFTVAAAGMRFLGVREDLRLEAGERSALRVNYLRGRDASKHLSGIPTYSSVVGREAWPGIDLRYESEGSGFEYSFEVAPGADAGAVALAFDGVTGVEIDGEGSLLVSTPGGTLRHTAPVAWQEGNGGREPVDVAFLPRGDGSVGFSVGSHDPSRAVFIDPTVDYSEFHGGQGDDTYYDVRADGSGNAYMGGTTYEVGGTQDYPYDTALGAAVGGSDTSDVIVAKFDTAGAAVWATIIGGETGQYDEGYGLAVDGGGDPYVAGYTDSSSYPVSGTPFQGALSGAADAFVTGLDSSTGATIQYSSYLGGSDEAGFVEYAQGVAVDSSGNIHVVGVTTSTDFTSAANAKSTGQDAWYAVMDAAGSLSYMEYIGGTGADSAFGVATDANDSAFVCGQTTSTAASFPLTTAYDSTLGGTQDGFVRAIDNTQTVIYSTYLGGGGVDSCLAITVDGSGDAWVTGTTLSTNFPVVNAAQAKNGGARDAFAARLHWANTPATTLTYSSYFGGNIDEFGYGIAIDPDGIVAIAGRTNSTVFPFVSSAQTALAGGADVFAARIDPTPSRSAVLSATLLGGTSTDVADGVAVTSTGEVIAGGWTQSSNYPAAGTYNGATEGHVNRLSYEEVDFTPYWGHLTDSITAGKDIVNLKCWYDYSNRAGATTFSTSNTMVLTVTPPANLAMTLDTSSAGGSWTTKVVTGQTIHTYQATVSGVYWRVRVNVTLQTMEIYLGNFSFANAPAVAPYIVDVDLTWSGLTATHASKFRNSATFNATKNNSVLRRP